MAFDDLWSPIGLTLALAGVTTIILLMIGVPIAWGLTRWKWRGKEAVAAVLARTLAFSFPGLVIGSVIYSLPFMVQPVRNAFEAMGERPLEVAATLRAGPWDRFFSIALPLARAGLLEGAVLAFAHTVGEFGVVLMVGGNIPGKTKVVSLALFDYVEAFRWGEAHVLAFGLVVFSFLVISSTMLLERRLRRVGQ
jgi:molybdate transport system permease protein